MKSLKFGEVQITNVSRTDMVRRGIFKKHDDFSIFNVWIIIIMGCHEFKIRFARAIYQKTDVANPVVPGGVHEPYGR